MKKIIYIFGNPLIESDSLPIKIASELRIKFPKFKFIIKDPNENLKPKDKSITIIDTVLGIKKVTMLRDIDLIENSGRFTMHDFDLGFNLKLLVKIGELDKDKIFIIGVPVGIEKEKAVEEIGKAMKNVK